MRWKTKSRVGQSLSISNRLKARGSTPIFVLQAAYNEACIAHRLGAHSVLLALFIIVFMAASLARLPAALVLPYTAQAGINIRGASGTIWDGRFQAIEFEICDFKAAHTVLRRLAY